MKREAQLFFIAFPLEHISKNTDVLRYVWEVSACCENLSAHLMMCEAQKKVRKNMTETEWLKHGYDMGIVEPDNIATETFGQVYFMWLSLKSEQRRHQTIDRIECTYRRYFQNSDIDFIEVAKWMRHTSPSG